MAAQVVIAGMAAALATSCRAAPSECGPPPAFATQASSGSGDLISLGDRVAAGRLRIVNRNVTAMTATAVRVTAAPGIGLVWIDGTDVGEGVIEADVCGRDVTQESFLGLAFHRQSDETYEAVYLRPFNFRSAASDSRQHAVQYVAMPNDDYARLRDRSPGEFEHAVDPSVEPVAWNRLRLVVRNGRIQAFVGQAAAPALDVRELQSARHGQVGLFVDNGSDGVFANLRIFTGR